MHLSLRYFLPGTIQNQQKAGRKNHLDIPQSTRSRAEKASSPIIPEIRRSPYKTRNTKRSHHKKQMLAEVCKAGHVILKHPLRGQYHVFTTKNTLTGSQRWPTATSKLAAALSALASCTSMASSPLFSLITL